jgi:hypothetical protein
MTDKPTEALERAEELLISQAHLSFDRSRVAIRRDDLRALVRLANAMHQASDTGDDDALLTRLWNLHRRAMSYASDKPAVNLLLADLGNGIRDAIDRLQAKAHE